MKFEIIERILFESRTFVYLRLFMIKEFKNERAMIESSVLADGKPDLSRLSKLTEVNVSDKYKKFMFDLVNYLEVDHHDPGQKVIKQNDPVVNEFDEWEKDAKVYFIIAGNYKVESLMFNMGKKQKDIKDDPNKNDITAKGLKKGDFFGEVSILFGCRRTATVKAKQYCECAFLKNEDFRQLIASNGFLKKFLI